MRRIRRLIPFAFAAVLLAVGAAPAGASVPGEIVLNAKGVAAGATATLYQNAQFKISGTCIDNGAGNVRAQTYIKTKVDNAMYWISADSTFDLDFDRADGRIRFDAYYFAEGTAPQFQAYDDYQEVTALSASGKLLIARTATGVHVHGSACTFSGLIETGAAVRNAVPVAAGASATLYENTQFKVTGTCINNGSGDLIAQTYIKTKQNNALYFRSNAGDTVLDFDKSYGKVAFDAGHQASGTSPDLAGSDYDQEAYVVSAGGKVLIARSVTGVHLMGANCIFVGLFQAGTRVRNVQNVAAGNTATLFENSQFKITGQCVNNGGGALTAQTYIKTKNDNALYYLNAFGSTDPDFDVIDGELAIDSGESATGASPAFEAEDYRQEVYAESSSGKVLIARTATGVHVLGADCTFSGLTISS